MDCNRQKSAENKKTTGSNIDPERKEIEDNGISFKRV